MGVGVSGLVRGCQFGLGMIIYIYIILHQSQYFQTLFLCLTKFDCGKLEFDLDLIEINLILYLVENWIPFKMTAAVSNRMWNEQEL